MYDKESYAARKYMEFEVRERQPLMDFLERQLHGMSRNKLKDILQGHGVSVDRRLVTRHDFPLMPGMVVRVSRHKRSTELDSPWLRIVYEDKDIVVIDKQPGILSAGVNGRQFCVKTVLDEYFQRRHFKCHAHVVHRLDKDTSGLMVYAKSIEAAQTLQENWKQRVYDRRYVAVLEGCMEREGGTVESWLKDVGTLTKSSLTDNGGRYAVTYYHRLNVTEEYSLVEFRLDTGRKNQIRVHMAEMGHPVCGDKKYGSTHNPLHRLCLHAFRLHLYHPTTGQRMEFDTPYPTSFLRMFDSVQSAQ